MTLAFNIPVIILGNLLNASLVQRVWDGVRDSATLPALGEVSVAVYRPHVEYGWSKCEKIVS
jgi:hypothetical protein